MGNALTKYRSHIYLTLALVSVFGLYLFYERRPQPEAIQLVEATGTAAAPTATPTRAIRVHVVGAVAAPGVYVLGEDARIIDAVQAAGGLTEEADPEGVNLADHICDGQQIRAPLREATPRPSLTPMPQSAGTSGGAATGATGLINLNTATAAQLEQLPGIGPVLAARIVDDREQYGPFATVDEIMRVSGIGEAILARIRDQATVQ
jgi:competence protein ComEA